GGGRCIIEGDRLIGVPRPLEELRNRLFVLAGDPENFGDQLGAGLGRLQVQVSGDAIELVGHHIRAGNWLAEIQRYCLGRPSRPVPRLDPPARWPRLFGLSLELAGTRLIGLDCLVTLEVPAPQNDAAGSRTCIRSALMRITRPRSVASEVQCHSEPIEGITFCIPEDQVPWV